VEEIVKNYFETIKLNTEGLVGVTVCVYNVVPPLEREKPENHWTEVGVGTPTLGTDEDRKKYTLYMNEVIKKSCDLYGYTFFDVYDKYTDKDGFLRLELSDTNCHIRNPIYMEEFIKDNLIKI
jgi:hypothetical protein